MEETKFLVRSGIVGVIRQINLQSASLARYNDAIVAILSAWV